jgi:methyl-accepting chemotaxis protein
MTEEQKLALEHRLTAVDDRSRSNARRIEELAEGIKENNNLIGAIKELAVETKYMREDLNETIERLNKLESKDGDKWDKFKWLLVTALVSIILGYIAVQVGLG